MNLLRKLRLESGLSQRELWRRTGIDFALISKAESGRILSDGQLAKLAEALDYDGDPADLLKEDNNG